MLFEAAKGSPGEADAAPSLTVGLVVIAVGTAAFASAILLLPTSRARTLVALLVPTATLAALSFWWLRERALGRLPRAFGGGLFWVALLFLGTATSFPATVIALLWGLPSCMALTFLAFLLWRGGAASRRRVAVGLAFVASLAPWPLLRVEGASGQMMPNLVWFWRLPAGVSPGGEVASAVQTPVTVSAATARDWPGFRGALRDGAVSAETVNELNLDWQVAPPSECWRRGLGRGWSSFAVVGELACTQDQADVMERVLCLDARTGRAVWVHEDETRFEEITGGPGPRATPSIHEGRVYSLGASGILNCLDAETGRLIWSESITDREGEVPEWGFASSPLIRDGLVYVSPAGVDGIRLMALDRSSGERAWQAEGEYSGYGSPQWAVLDGTPQVLLFDGGGLAGYEPRSGELLWAYEWPTQLPKVAQPHVVTGDSGDAVIVGMGYGRGTKSLHVAKSGDGWNVEERWSSSRLKPKFNDFVIRGEHIFGLDEGILVCVDASTGERLWKGDRYGYGQLLLLGEVLLIVTESGDLVLVKASPEGHEELARVEGLTGKTWSHPAIAGERLFIRNGSEAACYDLGNPDSILLR